jgi:hypothetical protein
MGLSKTHKCLFPFVITSPISPNKFYFFILIIQLMVHISFNISRIMSPFKNVYGLWHKMKHKCKCYPFLSLYESVKGLKAPI